MDAPLFIEFLDFPDVLMLSFSANRSQNGQLLGSNLTEFDAGGLEPQRVASALVFPGDYILDRDAE